MIADRLRIKCDSSTFFTISTRRTRRTPARQRIKNSVFNDTVGGTGEAGNGDNDEHFQSFPGRQLGASENGISRGNNNDNNQKHSKYMRDASEKQTSERKDLAARHTLLKTRIATLRQRREIECWISWQQAEWWKLEIFSELDAGYDSNE